MEIYKFGGASVKDEKGIKNLALVLKKIKYKNCILIVSAMGKMTNAFEDITNSYYNKKDNLNLKINFVKDFHTNIINSLFKETKQEITIEINQIFTDLDVFIKTNTNKDYNYIYDQIVSLAELISTKIISSYLNINNINNNWVDARNIIKTDANFREAKVNWTATNTNINNLNTSNFILTQGFIGSNKNNSTTTLGREGSDYTAAIFAHCLNAKSVSVFKDVAGVLNADPNQFKNTVLLNQISYNEAIEMSFYGATIIHPKTIKPLQNKEIPLYVKSFNNPLKKGTLISNGKQLEPKTACYIIKKNQILISISTKDFSFIMENNISEIFNLLHKHKLHVSLIQNTAISFSVCITNKFNTFTTFLKELKLNYKGLYNENVTLITIRHFTKQTVLDIEKNNTILLKQTSRETVQFIVKK